VKWLCWCLFNKLISLADTVERNILDLAARSGLSLYIKGNATGTISPTRFTTWNSSGPSSKMARSKKQQQKGDYIFRYLIFHCINDYDSSHFSVLMICCLFSSPTFMKIQSIFSHLPKSCRRDAVSFVTQLLGRQH
jgi:hypothetical protein